MAIAFNWLAITVATVASVAIAFLWYTPGILFGKAWNNITGITKGGKTAFITLWITNFITALGMNFFINLSKTFYNDNSIIHTLLTAVIVWLAFSAATLVQHNAFEHKSLKLTLINIGYQLTIYLAMALVLVLFTSQK